MREVNLLIGSGGRRNYLVNWFREAMDEMGIRGTVSVIDATPHAPALADADRAAVVPPFSSGEYFPALESMCKDWNIGLAFSVNDYEATLWASHDRSPFADLGINLIAPSSVCQALVEDKAAYSGAFGSAQVLTPRTLIGTEAVDVGSLPWDGDVIIKHRYGSGSVGLTRAGSNDWLGELQRVAAAATDRFGSPVVSSAEGLENVVVQQAIEGVEHGLDIVHDFDGNFVTALARRKMRMRSGETDQAKTVDVAPFLTLAQQVGAVTGHRGLIDTDVMVDSGGLLHVLDVNPRFGGGYPFSHVAGVRIPHAYLAWHLGEPSQEEWLRYQPGVVSAKTEDIRVARAELTPADVAGVRA